MPPLAGRQYLQTRVFAAGWSEHNRCVVCLYDIVQADAAKNGAVPVSVDGNTTGMQARSLCSHQSNSSTDVGGISGHGGIPRGATMTGRTEARFKTDGKERLTTTSRTAKVLSR